MLKRSLPGMLMLALSFPGMADESAGDINFRGTLRETPSCTINNNQAIEVTFGNVMTNRVNGSNYEQTLYYTMSCKNYTSNSMKIQISGSGTGSVLLTNVTGLGIRLKKAGTEMWLNTGYDFTYPTLPVLTAVPVNLFGSALPGGNFSATATMRVEYQ